MKKRILFGLIFALTLMFPVALTETPVEEEPTYLHTEFVIERFLNQVPEYEFYMDGDPSPYMNRIAFFAAETLSNFRFLSVQATVSEDGQLRLLEDEVLFTLDSFSPDKPLVIEMELPEILPLRAFAFETADGDTHFCYPALSGECNMPLLVPCLIETRDIPA